MSKNGIFWVFHPKMHIHTTILLENIEKQNINFLFLKIKTAHRAGCLPPKILRSQILTR